MGEIIAFCFLFLIKKKGRKGDALIKLGGKRGLGSLAIITPETIYFSFSLTFFLFVSFSIAVVSDSALSLLDSENPGGGGATPPPRIAQGGGRAPNRPPPEYAPVTPPV